jgi:hypothetical protein
MRGRVALCNKNSRGCGHAEVKKNGFVYCKFTGHCSFKDSIKIYGVW